MCARRQGEILHSGAELVMPGGRLVYSTCTLNHIENEGVVAAFLARHPDFALKPFALPGLDAPQGMLTIYPHRVKAEGHFVALLTRNGEDPGMAWAVPELSRKDRQLLATLTVSMPCDGGANWLHADPKSDEVELRCIPALPEGGLPMVLRCGVNLGTVKLGRNGKGKPVFTPDHAWAVCCDAPVLPRIALTEEDARRYQHGETIPVDGQGWALACYEGIALGWGKISGGMMKNHYPKGLRR